MGKRGYGFAHVQQNGQLAKRAGKEDSDEVSGSVTRVF